MTRLSLAPIGLREAQEFIARYHRHHKPPAGYKFAIAAVDGEKVRGVVTVGRPVARRYDDGLTAEVTRLCTDGARNACSMLYGAAWRAARAMGYRTIITYILETESGDSLRASGWKSIDGLRGGGIVECSQPTAQGRAYVSNDEKTMVSGRNANIYKRIST